MNVIPAQVGSTDRRDRHAGADRRSRRLRAQSSTSWRTFARSAGVRLRPHAKTHKCPTIALKQIAAGRGRPVLPEGRRGRSAGARRRARRAGQQRGRRHGEASPAGGARRATRRSRCASIRREQVDAASRAATEFGVSSAPWSRSRSACSAAAWRPGKPPRDLARCIADAPGLRFRGLQAYHGTAQHLPSFAAARARDIATRPSAVRDDGRRCSRATALRASSSAAPEPALSRSRRRAGCGTSCRPARTCSWTPITRGSAAGTAAATPTSGTACSCWPR